MLVLTRKTQEKIQIGDSITITILKVHGRSVKVGIEAPRDVRVVRAELPLESAGRSPISNNDQAQCGQPDPMHRVEASNLTPWNPGEAATFVEMEAEFHFESSEAEAGAREAGATESCEETLQTPRIFTGDNRPPRLPLRAMSRRFRVLPPSSGSMLNAIPVAELPTTTQ
mgnify:CR=1 FL=1